LPGGNFSHKQATLMRKGFPAVALVLLGTGVAMAQSPYESAADFAKYARKLREQALLKVEPQVFVPTASRTSTATRYPWKANIVTTVFWVGEQAGGNNPVPKTTLDPTNANIVEHHIVGALAYHFTQAFMVETFFTYGIQKQETFNSPLFGNNTTLEVGGYEVGITLTYTN